MSALNAAALSDFPAIKNSPQPINLSIRDHAHGEPPSRWRFTIKNRVDSEREL